MRQKLICLIIQHIMCNLSACRQVVFSAQCSVQMSKKLSLYLPTPTSLRGI